MERNSLEDPQLSSNTWILEDLGVIPQYLLMAGAWFLEHYHVDFIGGALFEDVLSHRQRRVSEPRFVPGNTGEFQSDGLRRYGLSILKTYGKSGT